jgi:hypothetical protein
MEKARSWQLADKTGHQHDCEVIAAPDIAKPAWWRNPHQHRNAAMTWPLSLTALGESM